MKLGLVTGALALVLAAPSLAQGQGHGNGHGNGNGNGHAAGNGGGSQKASHKGNGSGGMGHAQKSNAPKSNASAKASVKHGSAKPQKAEVAYKAQPQKKNISVSKHYDRGHDAPVVKNSFNNSAPANWRTDRYVVRHEGNIRLIRDREPGLINGCPPGLRKKYNGCLPPGQAKKLVEDRRTYWDGWRYHTRYQPTDSYVYRYNEGYLYRINRTSLTIASFVPLLGGALYVGNAWPDEYSYSPVPDYYRSYYGYGDNYDYRYADGVVYGVDPQTSAIEQIAALLTGDNWAVGQPMPAGYGVYNVPPAYRSQYYDTPDAMYRYSDGYVYRVDPTTQLIAAAIQLATS